MWKHLHLVAIALCIAVSASTQAAAPTSADAYQLGVADKLRIRAYEWRNSVGEVHEWAALNDEFTVGPSGELSLPLVGLVPAAGKTTGALADTIAERMQSAVGMGRRPQISVEIVRYRPFYIVGTVANPGEYPYRPGLTVLQAVSIAGGLFRPTEASMIQFQRSARTTAGELRVLVLQYNRLVARRARLQAELDGSDVKFPPELTQRQSDPEVAAAMKQELQAFTAHRDALQIEVVSRNQLKDLLAREVVSLQQKIANADQEVGMLQGELTKVTEFVRKGLAVAPREFSLRQNGMELHRTRLDLDTAVLRAREEIGKTDQGILELQNQNRKELLREIDDTNGKLTEASAKMATIGEIVRQDEATMPGAATAQSDENASVVYTIVRRDETGLREVEAAEATAVHADDTIRVRRQTETPIAGGESGVGPGAALIQRSPPAITHAKSR
jgi:polysaccharide export outer membrane protein/exopolysaccharide production protein ExoF